MKRQKATVKRRCDDHLLHQGRQALTNPYQRLAHIRTSVSTAIPMASIALAFYLLTRDDFDSRTHILVANKSDPGELKIYSLASQRDHQVLSFRIT